MNLLAQISDDLPSARTIELAQLLAALGSTRAAQDRPEEAAAALERARAIVVERRGTQHAGLVGIQSQLALARIDMEGEASVSDPSRLEVRIEAAAASLPGRPPQRLALFDYARGQWDVVDERLASLEDSMVNVAVSTDAADFVAPETNAMRLRLEWFDPGSTFTQARIDHVSWGITP